MKVATIVPTAYLHLTKDDDYFMALAHLVGMDEEYTEFFRARAEEGKYILMDNSIVEGEQQSVKELIRRGRLIKATEVILPDTIGNGPETIMKSYESLPELRGQFRIMIVPQGCNVTEWYNCAATMFRWWGIHSVGISKFILNAASDARERCIESIQDIGLSWGVHLLGVYRDLREVQELARKYPFIRGVDSSVAYTFTREGEILDLDTPKPRSDLKIDFDDVSTDEQLLKENIEAWRRIAGGDL